MPRADPGNPRSACAASRPTRPRIRTASNPALRAPPIDTVATGTPAGICTIDSSESRPSSVRQRHRHADHRQRRGRRDHAGQVGRAARAGDDHLDPALGGGARVVEHAGGSAMCGDHADLERDVELGERMGGGLHDRPVAVAAHDQADPGAIRHARIPSVGPLRVRQPVCRPLGAFTKGGYLVVGVR